MLPRLMNGQSNCGELPHYTAGSQGSLESGWGLINAHSSSIYACKGLLEWSFLLVLIMLTLSTLPAAAVSWQFVLLHAELWCFCGNIMFPE